VQYDFRDFEKGKQMNESLLIDFEEAGRLLGGLHPNTLRQRKGGTENLTHVSTGERYLSTPLFADVPADMTEEELGISRSTPGAQLKA
jgi:cysteine synthase A